MSGLSTKAIHAGHSPDKETLSRAVPIYQTTAYAFRDAQHAANLFNLTELGNIYTRLQNPTNTVLEQRLAAMHNGIGAVVTASGMSAIFYAIATITSAGQNFVSSSAIYGGTVALSRHTLKRFGIEARLVDTTNLQNVENAIDENTRLIFCETIGNPKGNVENIPALAEIAHRHKIPLIVDNTVTPPPLFDAFGNGVDIVVNSLTKIVGGHGTSMGGIIIERGDFAWNNGKFPEIDGADASYHGYNFWQVFGQHEKAAFAGNAFTAKIRTCILRDTGACLSPFNAQQILLGVETLPLRAKQHCKNAREIAQWLSANKNIAWVIYPDLENHPQYELAKKYYPLGAGALIGFGVKGGYNASKKFIESVKLATHLTNLLDTKTLVTHPASTTHRQLSADDLIKAGVTPDFIRLSVGLEDVEDIKADLAQAIESAIVNG